MRGNKRRRSNGGTSAARGPNEVRDWGDLPREIVAMIASYACPPLELLPFTGLAQVNDPDACAYHRHEDRTYIYPGGQFGQHPAALQPPPPASQPPPLPGGSAPGPSGAGGAAAAAAAAPPPPGPGPGPGAAGGSGGVDPPAPGVVPGTFRPTQMSDTALAMRRVCRLWCVVLSEGVRRMLVQDPQPVTLWAPHFPNISHLALGSCTELLVRNPDPEPADGSSRRGDDGADAGPGPSSTAAAAAAAGSRRRSSRRDTAAKQSDRGSGRSGAARGDAHAPAAAAGGHTVRSLAALRSLRVMQVNDSAVHLDLAASCPQLEELVVCAQHPSSNFSSHLLRDNPFAPLNAFGNIAFGGGAAGAAAAGRRAGGRAAFGGAGGGSAAAPVTRRSALDHALSALPGLQRLRLSGVDASAARLGSAMMTLGGLTSLRLHQCSLPTFLAATQRGRGGGHSTFGRELLMNLGAKLRDLSLQGCCLRVLPREVLAGLTGLTSLDLSANWLAGLPDSVTCLVNLEYLDLQHNSLTSLPEGLGTALTRLVDLDLSVNQLHRLPPDFGALTALTHLHLGGLHGLDMVTTCPLLAPLTNLHSLGLCDIDLSDQLDPFFDLQQQHQHHGAGGAGADGAGGAAGAGAAGAGGAGGLHVNPQPAPGGGPLQALVAALGPAGRLRELLLDGCGLDSLPGNFSQLTALSHLSVMENFDASGLPGVVTSLRSLAVLRLGYLDLYDPLPAGLFDELTGLRELDLEQNFLPGLSADVSKLTGLQVLNLMDALDPEASVDAVPWIQIYTLTRLRRLSVGGQEKPGRLPRGFGALTALELLHLHGLPLAPVVAEEICSGARNLTSLTLSAADLATLPAAITRLTRLAELQLDDNRMSRLPSGFGALTRLTELGLRDNPQLRALPGDITRLSRLRCLSCSVSKLVAPSKEQLAWMARLPELVLQGEHRFKELAEEHKIHWPVRHPYY